MKSSSRSAISNVSAPCLVCAIYCRRSAAQIGHSEDDWQEARVSLVICARNFRPTRHLGRTGDASDGTAHAEAEVVLGRWNRRLASDMLWSPTIRAALLAETLWLDVFCPGCGTSQAVDLPTIDRHRRHSFRSPTLGYAAVGLVAKWLKLNMRLSRGIGSANRKPCPNLMPRERTRLR